MTDEVRSERFVVHLTDEELVWVDYAAGAEIGETDARALIDAHRYGQARSWSWPH